MKIVLLNGPAGSGKDTIGHSLVNKIKKSEVVKFATPLKTTAMHLYCNGSSKLFNQFDHDQEKKNEKHSQFLGMSCRDVQIAISEQYMKPVHGQNVFGKILSSTIDYKNNNGVEVFFVTDSGFRPEAEELVKEFGAQNVILINLIREGHTFEGDSRDYIELDDLEVARHEVNNVTGKINDTITEIKEIINGN